MIIKQAEKTPTHLCVSLRPVLLSAFHLMAAETYYDDLPLTPCECGRLAAIQRLRIFIVLVHHDDNGEGNQIIFLARTTE